MSLFQKNNFMWVSLINKLRLIIKDRTLRNRIIFVFAALFVFRLFAAIPIPGVDTAQLQRFFSSNQFLGLLNIFSGGGLSNISIMMLGVGPYITASIIMQLLTMMSEKLKAMYHEEGEAGRKKFTMISRYITVPLAVIQGVGFIILLQRQGILPIATPLVFVSTIASVVAGSLLLTWLGELISEFGIGNGMSLIIFAGIVAGLPTALNQVIFTYTPAQIPSYLAFVFVSLIIVAGVVIVTEAERPIPVTYAKQTRSNGKAQGGSSTYLPLRINQAGVMPIIFALSILLLPQIVSNLLVTVQNDIVQNIVRAFNGFSANLWSYGITYFVLVFLFTYFYTAVTFDPDAISKNLQRNGAFIPGVRPGEATSKHIASVLTRITMIGAIFLGAIAVLPIIVQGISGITSLTIGGTSLLIAVSVLIDLIKKIDAQVSLREY